MCVLSWPTPHFRLCQQQRLRTIFYIHGFLRAVSSNYAARIVNPSSETCKALKKTVNCFAMFRGTQLAFFVASIRVYGSWCSKLGFAIGREMDGCELEDAASVDITLVSSSHRSLTTPTPFRLCLLPCTFDQTNVSAFVLLVWPASPNLADGRDAVMFSHGRQREGARASQADRAEHRQTRTFFGAAFSIIMLLRS